MSKRKGFLQSAISAAPRAPCRLNLSLEGLFSVEFVTGSAKDPEEKEPLSQAVSSEMRAFGPDPGVGPDLKVMEEKR